MNRTDKLLIVTLAVLTASVLATGGLAIYLTLARAGGETAEAPGQPTATSQPTATPLPPREPRIAFVSDKEGVAAIYVMDIDGTDRRRVSPSERSFCIYPAWSPDGGHVAYLEVKDDPTSRNRQSATVWVSAVDGTEHVQASQAVTRVIGVPPTWSPDGARLAFVAGAEGSTSVIHVVGMDAHVERSIPFPGIIQRLAWSPAGDRWLAVGGQPDGEVSAWLVTEAETTELFHGAAAADWSPDGEEIVVGEYKSRQVLIFDHALESRAIARMDMQPTEVAWSPDGAHIVVAVGASHRQGYATALYVVAVETGEVTQVVKGSTWQTAPGWSPDGKRLLFTMGPMTQRSGTDLPYGDLWVYDLASGELEQLTLSGVFEGLGTWSP